MVVENHESNSKRLENPAEEIKSESSETVFVGNHNLFDVSATTAFQKGFKTGAVEVDTGSDVCNDVRFWVSLFEVLDLTFEVVSLMFA
jgi:hypothetical protein